MNGSAVVLATAWGAFVMGALWSHRPLPRAHRVAATSSGSRRSAAGRGVAERVGLVASGLAGWVSGRVVVAAEPGRIGRAVLAAAAALVLAPVAAPAVAALAWAAPAIARRRRRLRATAAVRRQLPEVVDLLAVSTAAGATVRLAVEAVARRTAGPVGVELRAVVARVHGGRRLADELGDLPVRLGEDVRPLVAALVASDRDGAPLGAGLERLAVELRHDRRRRAEAAARRVPVKLLFPLVACILPAFALLTVAPLLAGALSALRL